MLTDTLPCIPCGGKCCHAAGFTPSELRAARLASGGTYPPGAKVISGIPIKFQHGGGMGSMVVSDKETLRCAFYLDGKCSIYNARPKVCRDYGVVPDLPCQELYPREALVAAERLMAKMLGSRR